MTDRAEPSDGLRGAYLPAGRLRVFLGFVLLDVLGHIEHADLRMIGGGDFLFWIGRLLDTPLHV